MVLTKLDTFFDALALKFRKETKLSDLVWVMCRTSVKFKNFFLKFCFGRAIAVSGEIEREYNRNGAIPDFFFTDINGCEYIIENKIYDRGDHFEQYKKEFPAAVRAFIANYKEGEHEGWFVRTWRDFIDCLEAIQNDDNADEEINLILSFVWYLKSVNYCEEITTMDFSNLSGLYSFYLTVSELIEQMGFENYNLASAIDARYYGRYFYYQNKDGKNVYMWLGLYIPEQPGVYIKFQSYKDENWLPKRELEKVKKLNAGTYYDEAQADDGNFYIHLKTEHFKKLCGNVDVNIQKEIIKSFLEEILGLLT